MCNTFLSVKMGVEQKRPLYTVYTHYSGYIIIPQGILLYLRAYYYSSSYIIIPQGILFYLRVYYYTSGYIIIHQGILLYPV